MTYSVFQTSGLGHLFFLNDLFGVGFCGENFDLLVLAFLLMDI